MEVSADTRLLGVIGDPVTHSLSPSMHNAAIRVLGLDAVYVALPTPATALATVLGTLAAVGGAGNVTLPHKEAAERCVTRKTDLCARVGACNTFWTEHGALVGDNTDVAGILAALRQLGVDGGGSWLLIGTGGAARAAAVAASQVKAEVHVLSRDAARAGDFAEWARGRGVRAAPARGTLDLDIAINATPAGLKDTDPLPLDPESASRLRGKAALDLTYAPGGTRWVRTLRAAGVRAEDGREVLVQQGAAAFQRFFPDQVAPLDVMRAAVHRALGA
ncbi:MAG TPA: shikimate dehydrogenase [Gemmatimonadales bacterium]|nr:shikimate dehydrogenase [Gemmatimonadales bacterium]